MKIEVIANKRNLIFALFIFFLIIVDQAAKQLATFHILPGTLLPVIGEFVYLTLVKNQGLVMGFLLFAFHFTIYPFLGSRVSLC